jgi:hypothetical protein
MVAVLVKQPSRKQSYLQMKRRKSPVARVSIFGYSAPLAAEVGCSGSGCQLAVEAQGGQLGASLLSKEGDGQHSTPARAKLQN